MEAETRLNTTNSVSAPVEKFEPIFFGDNSALYGCYHLPEESNEVNAVVICQSLGHEYERCHRAMRQLAVQSVRKGLAAMRFDYYGTGDSAGSVEETTLASMSRDIRQAVGACKVQTHANRLALVGIRLGATLAAQLACSCTDIESLVLYAPIFDGNTCLSEWRKEQDIYDSKHSHATKQVRTSEILGFTVTNAFQKELNRVFSLTIKNTALKRVLVLVSETDAGSELLTNWIEAFDHHGIVATVETPESLAIWQTEVDEATVPIKTIRRIVNWLNEN